MAFKVTIGNRLLALCLLGLGFVVAVGAAGYVASQRLAGAAEDISVSGSALKNQMQADMAHDALRADVLAALLAGLNKSADEEKAIRADLKEHADSFNEALAKLAAMPLDDDTRQAVDRLRPSLAAYVDAAISMVGQAFGDTAAAQARMPDFMKRFRSLEGEMEALSDLIEKRTQATQAQSEGTAQAARSTIVVASLLALALMTLAGWHNSRRIVGPIRRAVQVAETVAAGDLGSQIVVSGSDETAQLLAALQRMNTSLVAVVGTVRHSSDSISTGSGEIATGSMDLSQRTEHQASNLQQTVASMEQITSTVRHNADTARQAAELAGVASEAARSGGQVVGQMVATMADIAASSQRIAEITGVIDGIAFQTNILALNAAVEAARAGEQGRGFAVVASEVRTLAQRSAQAAREIKALIAASGEKVEAGSRQAGDAGRAMDGMVQQVQRVTQLIAEISRATQEQTGGVGQVSHSLSQLDQVTQQNAALVEESAAAAESLREQAQRLAQAVAQFRLA
jgi:methyl-accepting chemotaxis protein